MKARYEKGTRLYSKAFHKGRDQAGQTEWFCRQMGGSVFLPRWLHICLTHGDLTHSRGLWHPDRTGCRSHAGEHWQRIPHKVWNETELSNMVDGGVSLPC